MNKPNKLLPYILWAAAISGHLPEFDLKASTRNVTKCCKCGGKIGPGRAGRKCKKCREVVR